MAAAFLDDVGVGAEAQVALRIGVAAEHHQPPAIAKRLPQRRRQPAVGAGQRDIADLKDVAAVKCPAAADDGKAEPVRHRRGDDGVGPAPVVLREQQLTA